MKHRFLPSNGNQTIFNFHRKEKPLPETDKSNRLQSIGERRFVLSPSSLNIFRDCPRCFWLQINRNIRRPRGAFPTIASGLDRVIKEYFDKYRAEGILPPLFDGKIEGKLISRLPKKLYFNDNSRNASLMGMLDECLILPGNIYAPLDYKTRGSFPADVHPAYQLQMDVYTLLLEKNNCKTGGLAYLLYFIPATGKLHEGIPFNIKITEVKTSIETALDIFHRAVVALKGQMPASSQTCEYCSWVRELGKHIEK